MIYYLTFCNHRSCNQTYNLFAHPIYNYSLFCSLDAVCDLRPTKGLIDWLVVLIMITGDAVYEEVFKKNSLWLLCQRNYVEEIKLFILNE